MKVFIKHKNGSIQKYDFKESKKIKTEKQFADQFGATLSDENSYNVNIQNKINEIKEQKEKSEKMDSFIFSGLECSATQEDQRNIIDLMYLFEKEHINQDRIVFRNGSELVLTKSNIDDFIKEFLKFRNTINK